MASGVFASGGAQVFAKTTSAYIYGATYTNFSGSGWKDFVLDLAMPMTFNAGFDPGQGISYGVQLNTGSSVDESGTGDVRDR